jgi:hypothetical protein
MVEEILPGFSRELLEMKEILSAKPAKNKLNLKFSFEDISL